MQVKIAAVVIYEHIRPDKVFVFIINLIFTLPAFQADVERHPVEKAEPAEQVNRVACLVSVGILLIVSTQGNFHVLKLPLVVPPAIADTRVDILGVCPGYKSGFSRKVLFDPAEC